MRLIISWLWLLFYVLFMTFCLLAYVIVRLLKLIVSGETYKKRILSFVSWWGRVTLRSTGSTAEIEGRELIPDVQSICFIGNHQGLFDIPAFIGYIGRMVGFIAKQELFKVPSISHWMREIHCVFIDRKNPRKAMESFQANADVMRLGHPLVLFPEGTRSRSDIMGAFHVGSFKLPVMAQATIVPFAIKGSWHIYEEDKRIHKAHVKIRILPPVYPDDPLYKDKHALSDYLHQLIQSNLDTL